MKERVGIQSVEVGFTLLNALGRASGPLMLRDLAAAAGMSAAKAHRYLVSFQRLALVVQDPASTRYDLGPGSLQLGLAALSRLDAVKLARERLPALMAQVEHTLAIAVWGNHGPTIVHWEESPHAITVNLRLGDVMPLLTSATGRCFAAWHAQEAIGPLLRDELARARRQGLREVPATMAEVERMLQEVREHRIARVVDVLLPGVSGFCAPVFDADSHLVLGILAMGPNGSFDTDWNGAVARPMRTEAARLSQELGYRP
ncbi:IclR family transcriptional regulator [Ramlibacter sp. AW1]|uniref:IclR family transcriptional regulator n=1 Tax=Ramlibacter aurantiacus TaxID=2801330 RepID=A0A936ZJ44_9BURK|nr:IclR family transcriptional regulator [Ramlibacter aurantiacus]